MTSFLKIYIKKDITLHLINEYKLVEVTYLNAFFLFKRKGNIFIKNSSTIKYKDYLIVLLNVNEYFVYLEINKIFFYIKTKDMNIDKFNL